MKPPKDGSTLFDSERLRWVMMPLAPPFPPGMRRPPDPAFRELRTYTRWEYGTDPDWLIAEVVHHRARSRLRLLAWLRRILRVGVAKRIRPVPPPSSPPQRERAISHPPPPAGPLGPCNHEVSLDLGWGFSAHFRRCVRCGAVIVEQGNRVWVIGSAVEEVRSTLRPDPSPGEKRIAPTMEPIEPSNIT